MSTLCKIQLFQATNRFFFISLTLYTYCGKNCILKKLKKTKGNKVITLYLRARKLFPASYILTSIENCKMFYDKFLPWQKSWVKLCAWDVIQKWAPIKTNITSDDWYTTHSHGAVPCWQSKTFHKASSCVFLLDRKGVAAWENHSVGSDTVTVFFPVDFHTHKKVMHSPG